MKIEFVIRSRPFKCLQLTLQALKILPFKISISDCYNYVMEQKTMPKSKSKPRSKHKTKPLIETNPYLKDPKMREFLIERSVRSSSSVEGIIVDFDLSKPSIVKNRRPRNIVRIQEA